MHDRVTTIQRLRTAYGVAGAPEDRARPALPPQDVCYRSEAFAEDLFADTLPCVPRLAPAAGSLLTAVPLLAALGGAAMSLLA